MLMRHSNLWFVDVYGQRSINTQICVAECQPPRVVGHFEATSAGVFSCFCQLEECSLWLYIEASRKL